MSLQIIRNLILTMLLTCCFLAASPAWANNQSVRQTDEHVILQADLQGIVRHLENYGERTTWEKQNQALAWAKDSFETMGLATWIETYEKDGRLWTNTFAQIPGKGHPNEIILLIAHIDSIAGSRQSNAPGADDNTSGVAVLMELARLLNRTHPDKSIRFALFSNEERGASGSKAYARKARMEKQNIRAVINLDILGYNPSQSTVSWKMLFSETSLKYKIKVISTIIVNNVHSITNSPYTLRVAGKPENKRLVKDAATSLRKVDGLSVKEIIHQDCG